MTPENKRALALFIVLFIIALILRRILKDRQNAVDAVVNPSPNDAFYAPYYYTNPGIYNNPTTSPFESTVNIFLDNPALAGISNQYIPIFGFVGMTAVDA